VLFDRVLRPLRALGELPTMRPVPTPPVLVSELSTTLAEVIVSAARRVPSVDDVRGAVSGHLDRARHTAAALGLAEREGADPVDDDEADA